MQQHWKKILPWKSLTYNVCVLICLTFILFFLILMVNKVNEIGDDGAQHIARALLQHPKGGMC